MTLEKKLNKYADFIDKYDRIIGPTSFLLYYTGSENLKYFASFLAISDLLLIKTPFIFKYLIKTKDYSSMLYWTTKETVTNLVPATGLLEIFPFYKYRLHKYYKSKDYE